MESGREWEIVSEFLTPGYRLYAPDGSFVGSYDSMQAARSVLRELQERLADVERVMDSADRQTHNLTWYGE